MTVLGDIRLPARFWVKVHELDNGCWEWRGAKSNRGYGNFNYAGKTQHSHRLAYQTLVGPVDLGLELDHLCRNRACVNPAHLEAVTGRVNNLRGTSLAAQRSRRTHCPKGHALTGSNLDPAELRRGGNRSCYTCALERGREAKRVIADARRSLGLTVAEYRAHYGQSRIVAERMLGGSEPMVEAS